MGDWVYFAGGALLGLIVSAGVVWTNRVEVAAAWRDVLGIAPKGVDTEEPPRAAQTNWGQIALSAVALVLLIGLNVAGILLLVNHHVWGAALCVLGFGVVLLHNRISTGRLR